MAKASKIAAQEKRAATVKRYESTRSELKEKIRLGSTLAERQSAASALAKLPRDSSPVRLRNRDVIDGRPRGYSRKFGLSRIRLRQMAHRGELPGVVKSSW